MSPVVGVVVVVAGVSGGSVWAAAMPAPTPSVTTTAAPAASIFVFFIEITFLVSFTSS
jgi:hypothetical protein